MAQNSRVVIIGAGIVGVNIADELTARGWKNITVVEQGPLENPGGSTSHAPGLVYQTNPSKTLTEFAKYTVAKLLSIDCFNQVGGLEVAITPERLEDLKRKKGIADSWGVETEVISPERVKEIYPLVNKDIVLGGLHIPTDGLALAAKAVQVLIEKTRKAGVTYLGLTAVTSIDHADGHISGVVTTKGTIPSDIVISCAGFWGVEVGAMVGLSIPLTPMEHQYVHTTDVPVQKGKNKEPNGARLPILRHQDEDLYYREHGDHYGVGSYRHPPYPVVAASLGATPTVVNNDNMPSRRDFTPRDFEGPWKKSQEMLPALKETEIASAFNGIMSFTPDGGSLVGKAPGLDNFYVAEAVWVTHSAGAARAIAELLTDGRSKLDLADCDLARFEEVQLNRDYVVETCKQGFIEVYDVLHPMQPRESPRNLRVSPFYPRQTSLGAYFLETGGWERPQWFEANKKLLEEIPSDWKPTEQRDAWSSRYYSPITAAEAWKTRTSVALYDLTSIRRIEVTGPGAAQLLHKLSTSDIAGQRVGTVVFALFLDNNGGVRSDVFVSRLGRDLFHVGVNGPIDEEYLTYEASRQSKLNPSQWVHVRNITTGLASVGVWGPRAQDVARIVSKNSLSESNSSYLTIKKVFIAGIPVLASRFSYIGEPGWELYTTTENGLRLWDALWQAGQPYGIIAAGRAAFNALRIEKGFPVMGTDVTTEYDPYQAGLDFAIHPGKQDYVGYSALQKRSATKDTAKLYGLTIDDGKSVVMGKEPVFSKGGQVIGYVTSAAYGYSVGKPIAFAYMKSIGDGSAVEIEYFGRRIKATVASLPFYEPQTSPYGQASGVAMAKL